MVAVDEMGLKDGGQECCKQVQEKALLKERNEERGAQSGAVSQV